MLKNTYNLCYKSQNAVYFYKLNVIHNYIITWNNEKCMYNEKLKKIVSLHNL